MKVLRRFLCFIGLHSLEHVETIPTAGNLEPKTAEGWDLLPEILNAITNIIGWKCKHCSYRTWRI